jgi:lipopolysaccharide biosynthesis protein
MRNSPRASAAAPAGLVHPLFVSGSPTLTPGSVTPIRSLCSGIHTRHTLSLDFGSWHFARWILRQRGWSLDQFDRFVIANDRVFGPLFPIGEMWSALHDADIYGAIENAQIIPHLQSFFLAWDLNSRTRLFLDNFWNDFRYVVHKGNLIWR